jgi:hypothetical protein
VDDNQKIIADWEWMALGSAVFFDFAEEHGMV